MHKGGFLVLQPDLFVKKSNFFLFLHLNFTRAIDAYRAFFLLPENAKRSVDMARTGSNRGWGAPKSEQVDPTANPDYKEVFDIGYELPGGHPLAALGLSVVIAGAGALYLGWLGMQGFRAPVLSLDDGGATASPAAAWRHGFFSNLMNPKVILLYLALLPSFVETELGAPEVHLAILGLTIIAINIVWQGFLVAARRKSFRNPIMVLGDDNDECYIF